MVDVASLFPVEANPNIPELEPGDTVKVSSKVVEGSRERIQVFEGVVIRINRGKIDQNFTVRRIAHGVGVERTSLPDVRLVARLIAGQFPNYQQVIPQGYRGRTGRA